MKSRNASTVYVNAEVFTFDERHTTARAFAVRGDHILAVGGRDYVLERAGSGAEIVDLEGCSVIPGFIDSHVHLIDYGLMLLNTADLVGCTGVGEVQDRLRAQLRKMEAADAPDGHWIFGHGFDQERFEGAKWPTREDLDKVSTERPIAISRICGHAVIGNTRAFELCERQIPHQARQTGLVTEDDAGALTAGAPEPSDAEIDRAIGLAGDIAASLGITSVHCLLANLKHLDRLYAVHDKKELPVRFYAMFPYSRLEDIVRRGLRTGSGDDWLTIGAAKIFSDGSTGARTAAMHEDYADDPGNQGLLLIDQPELTDMVKHAQSHHFQCAIHAIGDRAVDVTVGAIEAALARQVNHLRHRVEHASQMTERAMVKMAHHAIPVALQPQFVQSDFWTRDRVGPERYKWAYPFRRMMKAGVPCAMSSDCYVERLDPYELIHRAWLRDEHSRDEALLPFDVIRAYTAGSAWAGHQEESRGTIEEGKLADVVVFPESPFELQMDDILQLRPELVLVGGVRHQSRTSSAV